MKVGVFRNSNGGCDLYRAELPIRIATEMKALQSKEIWAANLLYEVGNRTKTFWDAMISDIYLIQRLSGSSLIGKIKEFIQETKLPTKVVVDHDDDVFNVSPLSNHYVDYGTEEIKIVHSGKLVHEWKDGTNIDIGENRKRLDEIKRTLEKADLVTVTTDYLAEVFRPYNDNVRVLPNCVDLREWKDLKMIRENPEEIRIAWAGGHSHFEDLLVVRDVLIDIANRYPNVKILMVGYKPVSMEANFRPGQLEFIPWVDTAAHPYRMASLDIDIAIIPLKETVFNKGKSAIKWVEFSALKIPTVTSYVTPYKEVADMDDAQSGIYIENNDKQGWIQGLELLINSKPMRKAIGQRAFERVVENFNIREEFHQWVLAYEELLSSGGMTNVSAKQSNSY